MNEASGRPAARSLPARFRANPWYFIDRGAALLRARVALSRAQCGRSVGIYGKVHARLEGACRIGDRVTFRAGMLPTELRVGPGARLEIGEGTNLNYGVLLDAQQEIRIGARCMLASMTRVCDHDGDRTGPVHIGDDVWIAHGALVQPGVTIGDGAVISAGSVVTSDVPARHVAAGNPARSAPLTLVKRETPAA